MQARTLSDLVAELGNLGSRTLFRHRTEFRSFDWSYQQVGRAAYRVAALLNERGIAQGDRVMLWGPNSPQWAVAFLGCLLGGMVPVPIDLRFRPPFLRKVQQETEARLLFTTRLKPDPGLGIPSLFLEGLEDQLQAARPEQFRPPRAGEEDLAEILYTSGTTATPKGVMLTHRNLLTELNGFQPVVPPEPEYRFLSVLPLSHIFEQMGGLLLPIARGGTVIYIGTVRPSALMQALAEERPNAMMVVPRLLELLRDRAEREFRGYPAGRLVLNLLLMLASRLPDPARRLLFLPVHHRLGGHLKYLVSGGAALDPELQIFWERMGMVVLQGYGLTETSSAVSCNRVEARRPGSVGKPLDNQEVRLAPDGEILVRGPNVTQGYYRKPRLTADLFEDGWLKTGDVGQFDQEGFLYIRGRKKELIVTSAGINVYPDEVEAALARVAGVKESAVVEWQGGVHAVLLLKEKTDPRRAVMDANSHLDSSQKIRGYTVWPGPDLPRTPTMKVSRREVLEWLKERETGKRTAASAGTGGTALKQLVAELARVSPAKVEDEAALGADLGMDSIELLELVVQLEQGWGVDLPEERVTAETTVAELGRLVERGRGEAGKSHLPRWALSRPIRALRRAIQQLLLFPTLRLFCGLKVEGLENLWGVSGPHLLAANHASMLDAPVILMALPARWRDRTATAAWAEYFEAAGRPWPTRLLRRLGYYLAQLLVPIFPLPQTRLFHPGLRSAGELADRGWNVLIFPEGARTQTGAVGSFKEGVGVMASWLRLPVIPVKLEGMFRMLPTGRLVPIRGKVTVRFGAPLRFPAAASHLEAARQIEEAVKRM